MGMFFGRVVGVTVFRSVMVGSVLSFMWEIFLVLEFVGVEMISFLWGVIWI